MSRNDAKHLTEQFQAVLLQLQTAVAEIEDQINVALAALAAGSATTTTPHECIYGPPRPLFIHHSNIYFFHSLYSMDQHTNKLAPTATPPVVGYQLPPRFFLNSPDRPDRLSVGDREALSTLIAAYSFSPRVYDLMRFITAANSTIQGYLVKRNRYSDYIEIFRDISDHIAHARLLLDSPRDHGRAATILYSLEIALKIIAEREGLTQTGATMYEGRMPIFPVAAPSDPDLQEDPEDPYGI